MASSWTWMDFGDKERDQALEVIALFAEEGAVDELGLGTVRDTISDALFPGTSVLHTRARYFLFIPWIYRAAADAGRSGRKTVDELRRYIRDREVRHLIDALVAGGETTGVIGRQKKDKLKQVPSASYWRGLAEWGIRTNGMSRDALLRRLAQGDAVTVDDGDDGSEGGIGPGDWHPSLPEAPGDLFESTTFRLEPEEAEFLQERILRSHGNSLLGFLADRATAPSNVDHIWHHPLRGRFPARIEEIVDAASRFASVMHGAAILYQLWVNELKNDDELAARNREDLESWIEEMRAESAVVRSWRFERFAELTLGLNPRLSRRTLGFCEQWRSIAVADDLSPGRLEATDVRALIADRERSLKGPRARLAPGADRQRELWQGLRGAVRMDFRWRTAQVLLNDVIDGLHPEARSHA